MEKGILDQLEKFKSLVEDIRICMMISYKSNGAVNSRPMSTAKVDDDGTLWFFTKEFSPKTKEISRNNEIYLTYASPSKNEYAGFPAQATLVDDRSLIDELWDPSMEAWFPEGKDDPSIQLIKAVPGEAEYWEGPSSKLTLAFGMIKSIVTGEQFKDGEHGHLKV